MMKRTNLISILFFFLFGIVCVGLQPVGTWYGPSINLGSATDTTHCAAVADLDKNGTDDIVIGNYGVGEQNVIFFGNGDGTFGTPVHVGAAGFLTQDIELCDVNNDTWLDIVLGNHQQQNIIYMNDGDGTFDTTSYNYGSGSDYTFALASSDVNGDTLLDLAVGNLERQNYIYLNDGTGNPYDTIAPLPFGVGSPIFDATWDIVFAYMNGDTHLDMVVANHQQLNYVYLGDGDGTFDTTSFSFGLSDEFTHAVAVGYLNGDATLDVVECNYMGQNRVYLGDGTGNITVSHVFGSTWSKTQGVILNDVNGDTVTDVVTCNGGDENQYGVVYHGAGDGTLDGGYSLSKSSISWDIQTGDFNNDTLPDVVIVNVGQNYIYLNTDTFFDNIGGLFDINTYFVAGDNAYCTDVLGSAKIAFGLAAGGTSQNPEGRTDVILTAAEHDTGNLIPVGGPAINPVANEFDTLFGITYQYVENDFFQINAEGYSLYLDLTTYPERDICIVYLAEHNNRNIMLVWGYGWQGTYAGSAFIGDPDNWIVYQDHHMLMIRWIDANADGLVQMGEITVEEAV
jgi:hypothetical protein